MTKKDLNMLKGFHTEGVTQYPIIGYIAWWNIRGVDITQDELASALEECGFKKEYAREHNYRSAFIRAIRRMEEKRIIRKAEDTPFFLVYQFTAENKEGTGSEATLNYDQETRIVINKAIYQASGGDFEKALTEGRDDIKSKVIEHFHREKKRYGSSDITRYLQNILSQNADVCSLREQGCVYFVPVGYRPVLDKIINLVAKIQTFGNASHASIDILPQLDVSSTKEVIGDAFSKELDGLFKNLEKEIAEVANGEKNRGSKWGDNTKTRIDSIKKRIGLYSDVLSSRADVYEGDFDKLIEAIQPSRELDI